MNEVMQNILWKYAYVSQNAKMGTIKDRNCMNLIEAGDIKKRWQEYTEELYNKDLYDPDQSWCDHSPRERHTGMWSQVGLRKHNYKASGGDGIPVELFQIPKYDAVKVLHTICQTIWKTQQWHRTGKGQFSFQSQRKAMVKNVQTTAQLHSSHLLAK